MSFGNKMTAGAVLAMVSFGAQANLLTNGSFEDPVIGGAEINCAGGACTGWSEFGAAFAVKDFVFSVGAADGTQMLKTFGVSGVFQEFAVNPGDVVDFSADAASPVEDAIQAGRVAAANIEWFDAGGNQIAVSFGSTIDSTTPTNTWTQIAVLGAAAPAGAVLARTVLITGDFVTPGAGGTALFDNASVTIGGAVVPVPAAVWLFGSGLLGLVGVARRKA